MLMRVVNQLSSQVGDRTEASNRKVAAQCVLNPALLDEIAEALRVRIMRWWATVRRL